MQVFQAEIKKLNHMLTDQHISITVDETTDACGRNVVNILFSFQKQTKLVKTDYLDNVNYDTISQLIISTMNFYNIPFQNAIFFISDNAAYMKKAYSEILLPLMPQLKHNCCFAHIYSLVGDCWINYDEFKELTSVASNIKEAFLYSTSRKRRWLQFLSTNINNNSPLNFSESISNSESSEEKIDLRLPPLFVKTRWNSWFNFIFWLKPYFPHFIPFFINENTLNDPPKSVIKLAEILSDNRKVLLIEMIIEFITLNAQR